MGSLYDKTKIQLIMIMLRNEYYVFRGTSKQNSRCVHLCGDSKTDKEIRSNGNIAQVKGLTTCTLFVDVRTKIELTFTIRCCRLALSPREGNQFHWSMIHWTYVDQPTLSGFKPAEKLPLGDKFSRFVRSCDGNFSSDV